MTGKVFLLAVLGAVVAALAVAFPAAADQPTVSEVHIDRTRTIPAGPNFCSFPFVAHTEGTFREAVFSNGKDVTWAIDLHITYTNPATGKSVSTTLAGPFIVEPNGDGTATVTINGNNGHETAPGEGSIFADVGRLVYLADASDPFTPLEILQSSGQQDPAQFPVTCEALA